MVLVSLKSSENFLELSIAEFEKAMQMRWLDTLEFQTEAITKKVLRRSMVAMKKKELSIQENWIGIHFRREISKGFIPPISVRWIDDQKGYGVFAEKDFPAGAYLGEYTGMVRKRRRRIDRSNEYCFEYSIGDWIYNPFIIDADGQGNFTRYINHSDEPNLEPLSVYADEVMHIVLMTQKAIKKGEELCYHYGDNFWKKRGGIPSASGPRGEEVLA